MTDVDLDLFRAANHDLVTIIEQAADLKLVKTAGWKLWCMRCGLKGERLYQDSVQASKVAAELRSTLEPRCSR